MNKNRHNGTVDFYNETGGYGFIESETVDEDVFFHMEDVGGPDLAEGTEVNFGVEYAEKGPRAEAVRRGHVSNAATAGSDPSGDGSVGSDRPDETEVFDPAADRSDETAVHDPEPSGSDGSPAFCPYCGSDLSAYPDGSFCPNCGEEL